MCGELGADCSHYRAKLTVETVAVWVGSLARQAGKQAGRAVAAREGG